MSVSLKSPWQNLFSKSFWKGTNFKKQWKEKKIIAILLNNLICLKLLQLHFSEAWDWQVAFTLYFNSFYFVAVKINILSNSYRLLADMEPLRKLMFSHEGFYFVAERNELGSCCYWCHKKFAIISHAEISTCYFSLFAHFLFVTVILFFLFFGSHTFIFILPLGHFFFVCIILKAIFSRFLSPHFAIGFLINTYI